jgi:glycosyltransferase involved in cell wall biosynthesis
VDLEVYRPAGPAEKAALRAGLGLPGGLLFVFVGRLSREKRLEPFLKAFEAALRGGTAASLAIAGAGPEEAALRRAAEGLRGRVVFLPPTPDIAPVFRAADVFVLPSESEGLSNSLLEAMASGLAVLASRVGGTREAVEEERTGVLFEPGDAAELRMQLSRLMRDGRLVERLGRAAREAAAGYSIEAAADRYRRIYFSAGKD